ncbi:hypothetical protein MGG_16357 [Pyricularia oryzae 70-15]|uniref:Secreted protein n=3 Tax=Pyricularia oryzae TaxID=318829 RepID=G4MLD9_PYRO7|nr:uncharacterized protein MGG_16357 [Pyricularia oryzae 70-15]EHA57669.1 hypothetical protein MGG_16357 [Pyricularia oryzae 70-15]ELQ41604.1 hypothetical protein OOU_Y34scaffold00266g2 [Pyricularia oryzae Y34]
MEGLHALFFSFFFLFLFYPGVIRLGGVEAVDAKITAAKTGRARPPVCPESRRQPEPDCLDTPRARSHKAQPVLSIPSCSSADADDTH